MLRDTFRKNIKIVKLYQGANESAVNFGSTCMQSVYEQFKSLPAPATTVLNIFTDVVARSFFLA
jgi:hypothetical protein